MSEEWTAVETNTHQDHVIAHVIGATVLGYCVFDETLYVLLDIGFVWSMFVDGEMGLVQIAGSPSDFIDSVVYAMAEDRDSRIDAANEFLADRSWDRTPPPPRA